MAALQRAGKGRGRGRGIAGAGESCYTRRVFTSKVPNLVAVSRFVLSMYFFSRVFLISLFRNAIKKSREREGKNGRAREREKCLIFAFYDDPQQMSIDMKFHFTAAARVLVEISPSLSPSAVTTAAAEAKCNWPLS